MNLILIPLGQRGYLSIPNSITCGLQSLLQLRPMDSRYLVQKDHQVQRIPWVGDVERTCIALHDIRDGRFLVAS